MKRAPGCGSVGCQGGQPLLVVEVPGGMCEAVLLAVGTFTAEAALTGLLCVLGLLMVLVLALVGGRRLEDFRISRYRAGHRVEDVAVGLDVLAEMHECLRRGDFRTAHQYLLSHTNWFFLQRLYLPEAFSHAWLMLRHRVNRILSIERLPHDWARREVQRLAGESLRLVDAAAAALGGFATAEEDANAESAPQSSRSISAPSRRSLSSMRS